MEQRENREYQMISSRELRPCVPLCFLSRYGKSLYNVHFPACKKVEYETRSFSSTLHIISTRTKKHCFTLINDR